MADKLPAFDPKSKCVKCGWSIPDPVAPIGKPGPDGKPLPAGPPPPPQPPTVSYCNGMDCPWADDEDDPWAEHMHQVCDTCGYEWLAAPLG